MKSPITESIRPLVELAKPKVAIATIPEMTWMIRQRQGYKAEEKEAQAGIAKYNPVIYSHMTRMAARMDTEVQLLISDSRIPEGKVWKASLGGAKKSTVNLAALRKSMLAHGIQPQRIEDILNSEQEVTDEETGKTKLTQVVKVSQGDSVQVRMVNAS